MTFVCIILWGLSSPKPSEARCNLANAEFLRRAQVTCAAAQRDPVASCEAVHSSDGQVWVFTHRGL